MEKKDIDILVTQHQFQFLREALDAVAQKGLEVFTKLELNIFKEIDKEPKTIAAIPAPVKEAQSVKPVKVIKKEKIAPALGKKRGPKLGSKRKKSAPVKAESDTAASNPEHQDNLNQSAAA